MQNGFLEWLISNRNKIFKSPRGKIFGTNPQSFEITRVDTIKGIVGLEFKKSFNLLGLEFWRFETALSLIKKGQKEWVRLGTRYDSDDPNTIEYAIQNKSREMHPNREFDLKSAPYICDLLVLAGLAEYGKVINPITDRKNQAIKLIEV